MADIEFEIDGKTLTAKPGQTVMQVADAAGIYIPRFCYHKHLSIAANCRMCLVEVEKSPKTLPACATPVTPGMKVFTQSQKTILAQRAVMEFLLINHPLDCPICDQGGECELQDLSMGYGSGHSEYDEPKRSIKDQDLGPLIATDMTRCIYCTRCVRFGAEVAGMREMGGTWRGEATEIGTYIQHAIRSEVSGNIIDLCPVGALTSKPYRFRARAWELEQAPSISPHDCLGSNLNVHTRYGKVMRVVARENNDINETWLSDRDRFGYTGLYHRERLEQPKIRMNGKWQIVDWQQALTFATEGIRAAIAEFGSDKFGALASPSATVEEMYLLQKITRALGSPHVDHRLREMDTRDQQAMGTLPHFELNSVHDIADSDAICIVGSNLHKEVPLLGLQVRKAALKGASVLVVNPVDYQFNFVCQQQKIVPPHEMVRTLENIAACVRGEQNDATDFVNYFKDKQKVTFILGSLALHANDAADIRHVCVEIAQGLKGNLMMLTDGANSAGAWLAGAVPHRHVGGEPANLVGLSAYEMFEKARKAYLLLNVEPNLDVANPHHAVESLRQAKFVVALSLYKNEVLDAHADVILPIAAFTETSGTYVNAFGKWQSFHGVASSYFESRPAWKILRVLGNFLNLDGFEYESSEEIKRECHESVAKYPVKQSDYASFKRKDKKHESLSRIGEIPIYATDSIVRHGEPLQATQIIMEGNVNVVKMHPETGYRLNIQEGDSVQVKQQSASTELPVVFDARLALDALWIAGGIAATQTLGDLFGSVEVKK